MLCDINTIECNRGNRSSRTGVDGNSIAYFRTIALNKPELTANHVCSTISIDIPNNSLNVKVSDEELAKRKEKWQPREPKVTTGYLARYRELVTSGNRGAILEIPGTSK